MISTQRLIVLLISINFMIGLAMNIYYHPQNTNQNQINYEIGISEAYTQQIQTESGTWGAVKRWFSNTYTDITFGNPVKWGFEIAKILWKGLNPLSFTPSDFANPIEQAIAGILVLIRSVIAMIAGLEIYLLIFNRKQT